MNPNYGTEEYSDIKGWIEMRTRGLHIRMLPFPATGSLFSLVLGAWPARYHCGNGHGGFGCQGDSGWFSTVLLDIMQPKRADIDTKSCELKIDGKFSRISTGHSLETVKHTDWGSEPGKINLQECHGFLCRWGVSLGFTNDLWMMMMMMMMMDVEKLFVVMFLFFFRRNDWGKHGIQRCQTRRCKLQCRYGPWGRWKFTVSVH